LYVIITISLFEITICNLLIEFPSYIFFYFNAYVGPKLDVCCGDLSHIVAVRIIVLLEI